MAIGDFETPGNYPGAEPAARLSEERTQEPWNTLRSEDNRWMPHSCLNDFTISSHATGTLAGEDTGGVKTDQVS